MDGKKFVEVMKIEDTKTRCDRVLKEVLPFLKEAAEDFMEQYQDRYPELKELKLHTHEGTLRNARAAAGNETSV